MGEWATHPKANPVPISTLTAARQGQRQRNGGQAKKRLGQPKELAAIIFPRNTVVDFSLPPPAPFFQVADSLPACRQEAFNLFFKAPTATLFICRAAALLDILLLLILPVVAVLLAGGASSESTAHYAVM